MTEAADRARGIGHNNGPSMDEGASWRRHCWGQARAALLPTLPIEVVRLRLARAREIGLDYRTYATVRVTTGHDIVALLFSSNALRAFAHRPALPQDRAAKLASIRNCGRIAVVHAPLDPAALLASGLLEDAFAAPSFTAAWRVQGERMRAAAAALGTPTDRLLLIGDTAAERDWAQAGRLAGYLPADRYF